MFQIWRNILVSLILSIYDSNDIKCSSRYQPVPASLPVFLDLHHDVSERHDPQLPGKWISPHKIGAFHATVMLPLFTSSTSSLKRKSMCFVQGLYVQEFVNANTLVLFKLIPIEEHCSLKDYSKKIFKRWTTFLCVIAQWNELGLPCRLNRQCLCYRPLAFRT